jgi:hypothetical protein
MVSGKWAYRSYLNQPDQPLFGQGTMTFEALSEHLFVGTLDMGGGYVMNLHGLETAGAGGGPATLRIVGLGVAGSPTAGWRYDYHCWPGYTWPDGVNQVPSLVGTVVRVKAHGPNSPAGVVASFIAVSQG